MKHNIVTCYGATGIFKDKEVEIGIVPSSLDCYVKVNGKEIKGVESAHIHMRMGQQTKIVLIKKVVPNG